VICTRPVVGVFHFCPAPALAYSEAQSIPLAARDDREYG
jgi:hypothetical protein